MQFACPSCSQLMQAPDGLAGKSTNCPKCRAVISIPSSPGGDSIPQSFMKFSCPSCSHTMQCPEESAGKKATCPQCNQRILIPTPPKPKPAINKTTLGKLEDAVSPSPSEPLTNCEIVDDSTPAQQKNQSQLIACPFCEGEVPSSAMKCKHCGEVLDAAMRASQESRREADLLKDSTDIFGVIGFIISLFSLSSLTLACCGVGVLIAVPLGIAGAGCSLFGRGNLRVAGLVLNGISIFAGLVAGVVWIVLMFSSAMNAPPPGPRPLPW